MESYRTNEYCQSCWKSLFPGVRQPVTNDQFIKAIAIAGRRLLEEYRSAKYDFLRSGYCPAVMNFSYYETDMRPFQVSHEKTLEFKGNLKILHQELRMKSARSRDVRKLKHLLDQLDSELKDSNRLAKQTESEKKYLRSPFLWERRIGTRESKELRNNVKSIFTQFSKKIRKVKRN